MSVVNGKLLEVNLAQKKWTSTQLSKDIFHSYIGGYGLGVKLLLERMDPATDALGPGNILGMGSGLAYRYGRCGRGSVHGFRQISVHRRLG